MSTSEVVRFRINSVTLVVTPDLKLKTARMTEKSFISLNTL